MATRRLGVLKSRGRRAVTVALIVMVGLAAVVAVLTLRSDRPADSPAPNGEPSVVAPDGPARAPLTGVSYTRLAAVFHSDLPDRVGPVRSVRPADAALLGPLAPVFGNTMGAGWVLEYTDAVANWDNLGALRVGRSDAYIVDGSRPRPDYVFASPRVLLELSDRTEAPDLASPSSTAPGHSWPTPVGVR